MAAWAVLQPQATRHYHVGFMQQVVCCMQLLVLRALACGSPDLHYCNLQSVFKTGA